MKPSITLKLGKHKGKAVIFVVFEWNKELIAAIKSLTNAVWSQVNKSWYFPKLILTSDNL